MCMYYRLLITIPQSAIRKDGKGSDNYQEINLVSPPSSAKALEAALLQNPHLTSLPQPRADLLTPKDLTHTTGTAELLRLPEVQAAITSDFVVLPCDSVCELPGETLLDSWMVQQSSLVGTTGFSLAPDVFNPKSVNKTDRRRGGLGVWFVTKAEDSVKGTETDFVITTPLPQPTAPPPSASLRPHLSKLLYAITTDTLRDITEAKGGFPIRNRLIQKHGKVRVLSSCRAAHIYMFPHWILDVIKRNEKFDSISEDVVGWWAKAGWQDGLAQKLHMDKALDQSIQKPKMHGEVNDNGNSEVVDLNNLTSVEPSTLLPSATGNKASFAPPPMLCYIHPHPSSDLICRVDTPSLLLSTSLYLASLPPSSNPTPDATPTPLSHPNKIATDPSLIAPRTTIHAPSTLIAPNTSVATYCTIKSSCIGANCIIGEGAKITGSLLMDGVQVEAKAQLQGCVLGRRCVVGKGAKLEGCEIQEGFKIEDGTVGLKGEKFCIFEGLEGGLGDVGEDDETTNGD
ncbi:MAG: hypothetical protein Q9217_003174 [Psora testacea]